MPDAPRPGETSLSDRLWLFSSPLPWPIGPSARHCWLVAQKAGLAPVRWELWQRAQVKPPAWGHVHRDLCGPLSGMALWPWGAMGRVAWEPRLEAWGEGEWAGEVARFLEEKAPLYPYKDRYLPLPGPNSNGFIAWVLHQCQVDWRLPRSAWGKSFYPKR